MAKKKSSYRYRTKTIVRRARTGGGKFKNMIDGGAAGVLGTFLSKYIGGYGIPAAAIGVGYFRNNATLQTEGAREMGLLLGSQIPLLGGQTTIGGAY